MRKLNFLALALALAVGLVLGLAACGTEDITTIDTTNITPTYEHDIRPMFERSCVPCHTSDGYRAGGVELDRYETAYETRVKNACVSISPQLIDAYATHLVSKNLGTLCAGDLWEPMTMPPGAFDRLTPYEQLLLARWIELGAPR